MFTGIIEEKGTISALKKKGELYRLEIKAQRIMSDLGLGDSVATSGVCLTVNQLLEDGFAADVMPETLRKTSLGELKGGQEVNLERALTLRGRLGGHLVTGHIDGMGRLTARRREGNAILMTFQLEKKLMKYLIPQGSIAVDGVSLTVARLDSQQFTVSLIPHTASETTLEKRAVGERVNIEVDLLGKYVERFLNAGKEEEGSQLSRDFLSKHGFS